MKPALHRSIIFWSGLLVIGFIGWAWWDSMRYQSHCGSPGFWMDSKAAAVMIARRSDEPRSFRIGDWAADRVKISIAPSFPRDNIPVVVTFPGASFVRGLEVDPFGLSEEGHQVKPRIGEDGTPVYTIQDERILELTGRPKKDWLLILPHWLIVLAVAAPWAALLFWRAKRRRKAVAV